MQYKLWNRQDKINGVDSTSARATAAKANLDAVKAKKPEINPEALA